MYMPFGKFKGWPLNRLPDHYLEWLLDVADIKSERLMDALVAESERRNNPGRHQEEGPQPTGKRITPAQKEMCGRVIEAGYRAQAKQCHPDLGGKHEDMVNLAEAIKFMRKIVSVL